MPVPKPIDETDRLAAVRAHAILDSDPEPGFDDIVTLAARRFDAPIALISFVDEDRVWFKSRIGIDATELPRDDTFCGMTICSPHPLVVEDATRDARFATNRYVTGAPGIRFYAGAPVIDDNGRALGTICIMDAVPRRLPAEELEELWTLARLVRWQLGMRNALRALQSRHGDHSRVIARLESRLLDQAREVTGARAQLESAMVGRARAESDAASARDQLALALEASGLALWDFDVKSGRVFLDEHWAALLGDAASRSVRSIRDLFAIVHPDDQPAVDRALRAVYKSEQPVYDIEHRVRTASGEWKWIHSRGKVVERDGRGHAVRLAGTNADITGRKRDALLSARITHVLDLLARGASLEQVLTVLVLGVETAVPGMLASVLLLDPNGRQLRHGAAPSLPPAYSQRIDGIPIGPANGSCGTAAYLGERVVVEDVLVDPLWRPWVEIVRPTGLRACWSQPVFASHGETLGTFALYYHQPRHPSATDIALIENAANIAGIAIERKRTEEALIALNRDLEARVATRTAALETANSELSSFAYSIAHDLRAPVRALDGFSRIVADDAGNRLTPESQHGLKRVRAAALRLSDRIDGLLALANLDRIPVERIRVDVSALARAIAEELTGQDAWRNVDIQVDDGILATGDPRLLRLLLENLLGNACKFSVGVPTPRVWVEAGADTPAEVHFRVRDNGAGFDMAYADRLFQVFQRLHRESEFPGTGIGLATVKRIVQRHGGRVHAEGAVGQGATIHVHLPH